jgi:hypothetical protein
MSADAVSPWPSLAATAFLARLLTMVLYRVPGALLWPALLWPALLVSPLHARESRTTSDAQLRAAIILNIIRFVDFGGVDATEPLLLCVSRSSAAAPAIAALDGRRVGARPVAHRDLDATDASSCDVAYLGVGNTAAIPRVRRPGMLVIGDGSDFIGAGGTVGLVGAGSRLRFEANTRAAHDAGIKLSSRLLRLAARVR